MDLELDDDLYRRITRHTERGNRYCLDDDPEQAIPEYAKALELVPRPLEDWEAATWVLTALGDCHFLLGNFEKARRYLSRAMVCPGGLGTGFIHMRLGQAQLELGNEPRARDELARAFMAGGAEAFEDEDPKYFAFLRPFLRGV